MPATLDRPLLYAARPTFQLAGQVRPELGAAVSALTITETTEGLFHLEATFGNWGSSQGDVGYLYFDRALFDFGVEIAVELGASATQATVFTGRITALEGRFPVQRSPELLILAEDRLQDLRMTRRTRTWENVGTADVVTEIAGDHGLQPQVDVDPLVYPVLAQVNQSDLAFLRDLARVADAELWVEDRTLHLQARSRRRGTEVELVYGQTLREFAVLADLAHQRTAVGVSGWDPTAKRPIDATATESAIQGELDGGRSGASVLSESFGERADRLVHADPLSTAEAQARADARFRMLARRFVTGHAVAEGDGRIRVGARVQLRELGPLFNGAYYVTHVTHTFDYRTGYRTAFSVERPGLGGA